MIKHYVRYHADSPQSASLSVILSILSLAVDVHRPSYSIRRSSQDIGATPGISALKMVKCAICAQRSSALPSRGPLHHEENIYFGKHSYKLECTRGSILIFYPSFTACHTKRVLRGKQEVAAPLSPAFTLAFIWALARFRNNFPQALMVF
jgi:hypothetical protein